MLNKWLVQNNLTLTRRGERVIDIAIVIGLILVFGIVGGIEVGSILLPWER